MTSSSKKRENLRSIRNSRNKRQSREKRRKFKKYRKKWIKEEVLVRQMTTTNLRKTVLQAISRWIQPRVTRIMVSVFRHRARDKVQLRILKVSNFSLSLILYLQRNFLKLKKSKIKFWRRRCLFPWSSVWNRIMALRNCFSVRKIGKD